MAWIEPKYQKGQVDKAGALLVKDDVARDEKEHALEVVNNWRASHSFPLNTFHIQLKRLATQVNPDALTAQRIKRLFSIELKLRRFPTTRFSQMQDIAGCRAIMPDVDAVYRLVQSYERSQIKHQRTRMVDYINSPKESGYRGVHLIYRYYSDRKNTHNGQNIEIQIRSQLQHQWATAVETVGTFIKQALKSSQGEDVWLRFFALMGSAIALREGCPTVPGTPTTSDELKAELRELAESLDVLTLLDAYGTAVQVTDFASRSAGFQYYLLRLDAQRKDISIAGFKKNQLEEATSAYGELERTFDGEMGRDAVLVSVDSLDALRRAYPNYFLDTQAFLDTVRQEVAH